MRFLALRTLLPFFLVTGPSAFAQTPRDPLRVAAPAEQYARKAAANNLYQKEAGALVLKSSRNPEIRKFAQTMIADQARSAAESRRAAAQVDVTINPQLSTVEFRQMVGKLTRVTGEERDVLYLTQQRAVLERALFLHEDYAAGGDQPALQEMAAKVAPVIRSRLDQLDAIPTPPLPVSGTTIP